MVVVDSVFVGFNGTPFPRRPYTLSLLGKNNTFSQRSLYPTKYIITFMSGSHLLPTNPLPYENIFSFGKIQALSTPRRDPPLNNNDKIPKIQNPRKQRSGRRPDGLACAAA
jgi:hypothetical protein